MRLIKKHFSETDSESEPDKPPPLGGLGAIGTALTGQNGWVRFYPDCFDKFLSKQQQKYYHSNGHSLLIKSLKVEVFSQLDECCRLWNKFSSRITLFDTWDFRAAFWNGYRYQPYFLVLKNEVEEMAVLPLWYEHDKKIYTWFGSNWQEENQFLVKNPLFIPLLLAICPTPVELNAISAEQLSVMNRVIRLEKDDPKYILNLKTIRSVDDYLMTLNGKKRQNLRRDKKRIENQNPKIIFDRFTDFEALVGLSMKRFHEKGEDADWEDPRRRETFRQVIKLGQTGNDYKVRVLTVMIGGKIAAVDLIAIYNGCYYPLKCGYDVGGFSGIGNYVNLLEIEDAIGLGMKKMDFLEIGYGWKDKWFEGVPLWRYEKK